MGATFRNIATFQLGEEISAFIAHHPASVGQTFPGQALRNAGRRGLDPTLALLYKRVRSLPLLSRVSAMKAPSHSRSRWHRFWRSNVPGSNSRLISLPNP